MGTGTTVSVANARVHCVQGRANDDDVASEGDLTVWRGAALTNAANDVIGKSTGTRIQVSDDVHHYGYGKFINCFLTWTLDGDKNYGTGSLMIQGEYEAGTASDTGVTGGTVQVLARLLPVKQLFPTMVTGIMLLTCPAKRIALFFQAGESVAEIKINQNRVQ